VWCALRAHRDERQDQSHVPEVLERPKHDSALGLRSTWEWDEVRKRFGFDRIQRVERRVLRRRVRLQELVRPR
jgi:hypothetical protein